MEFMKMSKEPYCKNLPQNSKYFEVRAPWMAQKALPKPKQQISAHSKIAIQSVANPDIVTQD